MFLSIINPNVFYPAPCTWKPDSQATIHFLRRWEFNVRCTALYHHHTRNSFLRSVYLHLDLPYSLWIAPIVTGVWATPYISTPVFLQYQAPLFIWVEIRSRLMVWTQITFCSIVRRSCSLRYNYWTSNMLGGLVVTSSQIRIPYIKISVARPPV